MLILINLPKTIQYMYKYKAATQYIQGRKEIIEGGGNYGADI